MQFCNSKLVVVTVMKDIKRQKQLLQTLRRKAQKPTKTQNTEKLTLLPSYYCNQRGKIPSLKST